MNRAWYLVVIVLGAGIFLRAQAPAGDVRFITLPGFVVERVTPVQRTSDSYVNMTFDSLGRPVVSKEG